MKLAAFQVKFEGHTLRGDVLGGELPAVALMLHGAGQHHRGKMRPLREELAERGVGSCAFDFVGHGETGGELKTSSLAERTGQARAVIDHLDLPARGPLRITGASMGAHTAVELLAIYDVASLVLMVPAMYTSAANDVRFDAGFTEIIRRPKSWRDSEGWAILGGYTGRLLIIAGEHDAVIPPGVIELYLERATAAAARRLITVPDCGHMVFTELREKDPALLERIVDDVAKVLSGR